ncbi:MAG: efflux RND transporter permease subunit [Alphaproteobacteria bacterium]|nr:efflux RND transporter permease subunit [Alphaproteobacteria bacterium]
MFSYVVDQSLRNRLFVVVIALIMLGYGAFTLTRMPVDVFPDLTRPTVTLITEVGGLSAEEVEALVTYPIETGMVGMPGLERVRSVSSRGLSMVYLEFGWDTDVYQDRQFVVERMEQVSESLPEDVVPFMTPMSSIMGEIMLMGFTGDGISPMALRELVDWVVRPRIMAISGVAQVIPIGGEVRQLRVTPDPERMMALGITVDDLTGALENFGLNTGGGFIEQAGREYVIRNVGPGHRPEDVRDLRIADRGGIAVPLKQIADVGYAAATKRGDAGFNGQSAVIVSVMKQPGVDTLALVSEVKTAMAALSSSFPDGVQVHEPIYDQSDFISTSVDNVETVLIEASIVVTIVLAVFLVNARTTLISLSAIPVSAMVAILVLHAMGQSINTMTLGGLAIAIGELVDDAVVGVENVFRRLRLNAASSRPRPAMEVIAEASIEVRSGIMIATIIIVVVLVPLYALSGIEGRMFAPFATAYIIAILASLVTAVMLTPVMCYYLLPNTPLLHKGDGAVLNWLKGINRKIVAWALGRAKAVLAVSIVGAFLIGSTALLLPRVFMPTTNEGSIVVLVQMPAGTSLGESTRIGQTIENVIMQVPEVLAVGRRSGRAELDEHAENVNVSEINVRLDRSGRSSQTVRDEIRERLNPFPIRVIMDEPLSHRIDHMISGVRAKIALKLFGDDLDVLQTIAQGFEGKLRDIPGIDDVGVSTQARLPQISISVDAERASAYGIAPSEVLQTIQNLTLGTNAAEVFEGERRFDLVVRMKDSDRTSERLMSLLISTPRGHVPLSTFAEISESDGPNNINRENMRRRVVVRANASGDDMSEVVEAIKQTVAETKLPSGYFAVLDGTFRAEESASKAILILSIASLAMIFVVLYSRYKRASLCLMIMAIIPMATVGGIVGLWVAGLPLSIAAMFGFVTLAGITARNGILKISHYINLVLYEGERFNDALMIRGSEERLAPVLMTSVSAGLALIPLLFGGDVPGKEILHPIAVVIFSGLISALLLDTFLTPVLFRLFGENALKYLQGMADARALKEAF